MSYIKTSKWQKCVFNLDRWDELNFSEQLYTISFMAWTVIWKFVAAWVLGVILFTYIGIYDTTSFAIVIALAGVYLVYQLGKVFYNKNKKHHDQHREAKVDQAVATVPGAIVPTVHTAGAVKTEKAQLRKLKKDVETEQKKLSDQNLSYNELKDLMKTEGGIKTVRGGKEFFILYLASKRAGAELPEIPKAPKK